MEIRILSTKLDIVEKIFKYLMSFIVSFFIFSILFSIFLRKELTAIEFREEYLNSILSLSILIPYYFVINDLPATPKTKLKIIDTIYKISYRRLYYFITITYYLGISILFSVFLFVIYFSEYEIHPYWLLFFEIIGFVLFWVPGLFLDNYKKSAMYLTMYFKTKKRNHLISCFNLINGIYKNNLEYDILKKTVHIIDTYELFNRKEYAQHLHELFKGLETRDNAKIGEELCNILRIEKDDVKLSDITIQKELSIYKRIVKFFVNIKTLLIPIIIIIFTTYVLPYLLSNYII